MTKIVPFLLLGIGVDDIFVIVQGSNPGFDLEMCIIYAAFVRVKLSFMKQFYYICSYSIFHTNYFLTKSTTFHIWIQCFDNLSDEDRAKPLPERFGLTMKHAGVAITITSVTDLLAFGIGASSTLPALRSFSVFCSLGIFAVFICIITFFTAWFSLDQRRIEGNHNAFVCCYKHKAQNTAKCKRSPFLKTAFVFLSDGLSRWPVKTVVLVFSVSLSGLCKKST